MGIGLLLSNMFMFCAMVPDKCSQVEDKNNNVIYVSACIKQVSNKPYPIIEIGVVDMKNQDNYVIYVINRNCKKL